MMRRSGASLLLLYTLSFIWLIIQKDSVSLQQPNIKKDEKKDYTQFLDGALCWTMLSTDNKK